MYTLNQLSRIALEDAQKFISEHPQFHLSDTISTEFTEQFIRVQYKNKSCTWGIVYDRTWNWFTLKRICNRVPEYSKILVDELYTCGNNFVDYEEKMLATEKHRNRYNRKLVPESIAYEKTFIECDPMYHKLISVISRRFHNGKKPKTDFVRVKKYKNKSVLYVTYKYRGETVNDYIHF